MTTTDAPNPLEQLYQTTEAGLLAYATGFLVGATVADQEHHDQAIEALLGLAEIAFDSRASRNLATASLNAYKAGIRAFHCAARTYTEKEETP